MKVELADRSKHQLKKLPKSEQKKVIRKLQLLKSSPSVGKLLSGELKGLRSVRAWPYRIIYYIDFKKKTIFVTDILHRQGVYK